MTPEEFAERKAQLEAERRRGIELIEAVYREQLRGLEVLLAAGGGASAASPVVSAPPPPAGTISLSLPAPAPAAATPPRAVIRRSSAQLWRDLQAVLPRLPEVFTTPQLAAALGYSPHRGTLHRHLAALESQGFLRTEHRGDGRQLSRFRRLSPAGAAAAGTGGGASPRSAGERPPDAPAEGELAERAPAVPAEGDFGER